MRIERVNSTYLFPSGWLEQLVAKLFGRFAAESLRADSAVGREFCTALETMQKSVTLDADASSARLQAVRLSPAGREAGWAARSFLPRAGRWTGRFGSAVQLRLPALAAGPAVRRESLSRVGVACGKPYICVF